MLLLLLLPGRLSILVILRLVESLHRGEAEEVARARLLARARVRAYALTYMSEAAACALPHLSLQLLLNQLGQL